MTTTSSATGMATMNDHFGVGVGLGGDGEHDPLGGDRRLAGIAVGRVGDALQGAGPGEVPSGTATPTS